MNKNWKERIELIKELDEKRWIYYQGDSEIDSLNNLSPSEKILTHWISYITDRMMKVKTKDKNNSFWKRALPVFASWVKYYTENNDIKGLEGYWNKDEGFIKIDSRNNFKPRYPKKDKDSILRTFVILDKLDCNRNIIHLIIRWLDLFKDKEDVVRRIACSLFLLTYETTVSDEKTISIFSNTSDFENYYEKWMRKKTSNKKRLWAAFRDYLKHKKLRDCVIEALKKNGREDLVGLWKQYCTEFKYLNQLELPGDVWNKKPTFTKAFLAPMIMELDTETFRLEDVSQVAREICDEINRKYKLEIYPEMLDFTFEDNLREEFLKKFPYTQIKIVITG